MANIGGIRMASQLQCRGRIHKSVMADSQCLTLGLSLVVEEVARASS